MNLTTKKAMYSNEKYSLEKFKEEYAKAKKAEDGHIYRFGVFRTEEGEKVPIGVFYKYQDAINYAEKDCKETEGRYNDYSIEGIGWLAERSIYKFEMEFYDEITKHYRKFKKPSIVMDENARKLQKSQIDKENEEFEAWAAKERWYEEID